MVKEWAHEPGGGVQLVKRRGPERPKTWKIVAVDEDPDGETVGEFVVAGRIVPRLVPPSWPTGSGE